MPRKGRNLIYKLNKTATENPFLVERTFLVSNCPEILLVSIGKAVKKFVERESEIQLGKTTTREFLFIKIINTSFFIKY